MPECNTPAIIFARIKHKSTILRQSKLIVAQQIEFQTTMTSQQSELLSSYSRFDLAYRMDKGCFIQDQTVNINSVYDFSEKPIGQGSFGSVYKATLKKAPYSTRAVKVIHKRNPRHSVYLREEVEILKKLDHPNIIKLYEYYQTKRDMYLVLDLWEGGNLFDHIEENGAFSEQELKDLFRQILRTVNYLHSHKVCHRDIKLQNLLFDKEKNSLGMVDFGLAFEWETNVNKQLKKCGQNKSVGTAAFVAPQVLDRDYDERCDVWSLGVVLYMMATAASPFKGDNDQQIIDSVCKIQIHKGSVYQQLSSQIQDLITKILAPKSERISIQDIWRHPWLAQNKKSFSRPKLCYGNLKGFAGYSKLKKITARYIANLLSSNETERLREQFLKIDYHNDGVLTVDEIEFALRVQGFEPDGAQLRDTLRHIDMNKDGQISFNEFVSCQLGDEYLGCKHYLSLVYDFLNIDGSYSITLEDLQDQLAKMGVQMPKKLGREIMSETDQDQDGAISFKEFVSSMQEQGVPTSESEYDSQQTQ